MTFLNPFLLIGLAAAAIPIIIHLLNLRKLKVIEFSSLQFLKELQKTKMRRVKIRQILLLILRTLLIILLVLAFARPAMRGSAGTIGTHAKSTIVILLDDSPSMAVRDQRGVIFNQAIVAATDVLNLAKEGDELFFIRLSEVRHKDTFTPSSVSSVKEVIENLSPSLETASFRDALGVASKVLAESKNFNREIYIITDVQATQFLTAAAKDSSDLFDDGVKLFVVETGKQQENTGIVALDLKTQIISKNKPVVIKATVRNFGNTPMQNSLMSINVDGARVAQQSLDLGAQSTGTAEFTVVPKRRGMIHGYVQLDDDALATDNKRSFVVNVPENINVLIVGGKPQDTRLASLALTLGGDSSMAGLFSATQTTQAQLSSLDINRFDVLVFCGVKEFTRTEADRVARFALTGGGVMIFPDDETLISNWNETLFATLGIPPSQVATGEPTDQSSFLSFDKVDYDHPLFQGLFEQSGIGKKITIESPRVFKAIKPQAGPKGHTIISLSDGSGFLTEYATGTGRVLLFSVEANIGWSDLPLKGVFAPLLHRSIVYLSGGNQSVFSGIVGDAISATMRLKTVGGNGTYVVRSPGGIDERIVPHTRTGSGMSVFDSSPTTETGVYELKNGTKTLFAAAININPLESDLRHAAQDEMSMFWNHVGVNSGQVQRLPVSDKLQATVLESRLGLELWKYFLVFAILVALVEMIVGREPKAAPTGKA